jgi:hypothetical protein
VGGALFGVGAVITDRIMNGSGSIRLGRNGTDFVTSFGFGAISLGASRVYGYAGKGPGDQVPSPYDGALTIDLGKHELYHTTHQWGRYGVLFGLSWALFGGPVPSNPWERAADVASTVLARHPVPSEYVESP